MTTIINSYRDIFYSKQMPNMNLLIPVFIGSVILVLIGTLVFRKLKKGFAEEV